MKKLLLLLGICILFSCKNKNDKPAEKAFFTQVKIENILEDSISIRAIEIRRDTLFYAGNKGRYGYINLSNPQEKVQYQITYDSVHPGFRSVASTSKGDFLLSVANPALLYKVNAKGETELKYTETGSTVFYDSMKFWNTEEGIAMGDPTDSCMSIIITRDGGDSWHKIPCEKLPKAAQGEAAFAASNSNISIVNDKVWLISGGTKSRVYFSADKGKTWRVYNTPLVQGKNTTGGYSIDFYNEKIGVIIGGDYTQMEQNQKNKAISYDGGKTWTLLAKGNNPGYKSYIQFVPHSDAKEIIAVGPTGISYSHDQGKTWQEISKESFYVLQFKNDSVAYAAGKNRIAKLVFR